jgi:hypothetical protein
VLGLLHRFDGVAHEVEQNLLNLHLVREHKLALRVEGKAHVHTAVLGADEGQTRSPLRRARPQPRSLSPRATKSRNRRMIAATRACSAAFSMAFLYRRTFVGILLEQPAQPEVVGDGRKRLVEFVRERRCHLSMAVNRDTCTSSAQLLQPRFALWLSVRSRMNPVKKR